ncbi:MAG: hypothetical protein P4L49_20780 [Desulfosporosinus sp.]|nr:hypothetical protein [Desulfosporosinus sp.]
MSVAIKNPTNKDFSINLNSHFIVSDIRKSNSLISLSTKDLNKTIPAGGTIQGGFSYEAQSNHRYFVINIGKNTNDKFDPSAEIALINLVTP